MMLAMGTSTANADHDFNILEAKAEALRITTVELDRAFVHSYVRSRVFGEIMATSAQIKGKSAHLRVMAKYGHPCEWKREIERLDRLVCRLDRLVGEAHYRAENCLDPPIPPCDLNVRGKLNAMAAIVQCMKDALYVDQVVVVPRRVQPIAVAPYPDRYRGYGDRDPSDYYRANRYYGDTGRHGHGRYGQARDYRDGVRLDHGGLTIGNGNFAFRINF